MKRLDFCGYQSLVCGGRLLAWDAHGPKVIATTDGRMVKLFRTKRLFSAARWNPYATRFARNARMLAQRGIPTVTVEAVYRVPELARDAVVYRRLDGETLRDALVSASDAEAGALLDRLATFLATLHAHGILFRSIHFGNVLCLADGELGLIDVADMRVRRCGALTPRQRARNFRHMLRYETDRATLVRHGIDRFVARYGTQARLSPTACAKLRSALAIASTQPTA